ncbi:acetyl-CoA carboxylase, carboxyltransferase subunit beta [Streptomyces albidus (ex Kaewkla and Franco 2022)]|uniref:acetyl-CoA carboxylase, carboxyltransferase subunit beta n=1 Tax=Streptomyces albidus (ex Kaewkla and Franco 2022) TaxID=722709 RepID=UPI0015EE6B3D|nr:acetyl-CoA carboxylase, carboxyltransferase subunit beta [Streptomyces albidus (ex Kaewkla and Franco 2022)]
MVHGQVISVAEAEWSPCRACGRLVYCRQWQRSWGVCPHCSHHSRLSARDRIAQLADPGSTRLLDFDVGAYDPLEFVDSEPYSERFQRARESTGMDEAVVCARAEIMERPLVIAAMDFRFMGGSLGSGTGELITRAAEFALEERIPLLVVPASGGARMQEGALSLMQMAKTSQALASLNEAGILTVSLITDPTYGGVAASYASTTDVILAEPGARMGFAGPRVIRQTLQQTLPDDFQTAEFLLERGWIDDIVPRAHLRGTLGSLLAAQTPRTPVVDGDVELVTDPSGLADTDPWAAVQRARDLSGATTADYLQRSFDSFLELHGDRVSGDCPAVIGGLGVLEGAPVVVVGHQKGHDSAELAARNYGMASPAGFRKAARLMRLAGKLGLPVVTFIDTPGAYPGVAAEERGQAVAIAENLVLMSALPVPIVTVVIGEGGSGGALALGVADRVLMCPGATYSVISAEGCAAILWDDAEKAPDAARALRVDAKSLLSLSVVDAVLPEPGDASGYAGSVPDDVMRVALASTLTALSGGDPAALVAERKKRFRAFGAEEAPVMQEVAG